MEEWTDQTIMPFGTHKGKKLANVPGEYLLWVFKQDWIRPPLRRYIQANMDVIRDEITRERRKAGRPILQGELPDAQG